MSKNDARALAHRQLTEQRLRSFRTRNKFNFLTSGTAMPSKAAKPSGKARKSA